MNNSLQVVETNNQRVLTTAQIAEQYETDVNAIQRNFQRNKERYTEGKHYYCLTGNVLREFKATGQIDVSPNLNKFYLWTEKGALLHAKSLNTDKAWEAYECLVDTYFSVREQGQLSQRPDRTKALQVKEMNARVRMSNQFLKLANIETTLSKVDYGTLNAFSAGLWCYDGTTAYRVAEYYYSGREQKRQRTNTQYLQSIQQLTAGKSISAVIVDPSAASFIAELRQAGFLVRKGKNDVVEGIRRTAAALEQGKLLFSPDCKNSFREFALYRWDESSSQDRPIKENDHAMDDIRYFVSTILREQPKPTRVGKF